MFFESIEEVERIASRCGTAVFVMPAETKFDIKNALTLAPEGKSVITIEQIRSILARLSVRQTTDIYVIIRPAEALGEEAANALLKSLEEPGERVHFVLITESPSQLLPTVLSRASLYIMRTPHDDAIHVDDKTKLLAKKLIAAKGAELVDIAETIAKKKEGVRAYALSVIGTSIEMLYKSYFTTKKPIFIKKLPKFLTAYENIARNGHVKLQIVASLC